MEEVIMVLEKLEEILIKDIEEITRRSEKDILSREETHSYRNMSQEVLNNRIKDVYRRLEMWLAGKKSKIDMQKIYEDAGAARFKEGIPLHETILVMQLLKRHLWLFILEKQVLDSAFELLRSLEINNKVVLYFDRAIYYLTRGYEKELKK